MINNNKRNHFDTVFILFLLAIFALGSLSVVIYGINTYKSINTELDQSYKESTPLSYISSKVRQFDSGNNIYIENYNNQNALVLVDKDGDNILKTIIYNYNNDIYEIYVDDKTEFSPEDGNLIFKGVNLQFDISNNNLLHVSCMTQNKAKSDIYLCTRSYDSIFKGDK